MIGNKGERADGGGGGGLTLWERFHDSTRFLLFTVIFLRLTSSLKHVCCDKAVWRRRAPARWTGECVYRDRKALLGNKRPLDECSARFQLAFRLIRSKDNASLRSYRRQLDGTKYTTSIEAMSIDLVVVISREVSSPFCIHARAP